MSKSLDLIVHCSGLSGLVAAWILWLFCKSDSLAAGAQLSSALLLPLVRSAFLLHKCPAWALAFSARTGHAAYAPLSAAHRYPNWEADLPAWMSLLAAERFFAVLCQWLQQDFGSACAALISDALITRKKDLAHNGVSGCCSCCWFWFWGRCWKMVKTVRPIEIQNLISTKT